MTKFDHPPLVNKKLQYLQISRGIAALIVVLHHINAASVFYYNFRPLNGVFEAGWNGVDFFFVLSGFIIYHIHANDIGRPEKLKKFILKRTIRIYPIYWMLATVALTLIFVASDHLLSHKSLPSAYIIKSFLLLPQAQEPFLSVAWSLCYEMFFYTIFALGIWLGYRFLVVILSGYILGLIFQLVFLPEGYHTFLLYFLTSNFHIEFLIGIFTAFCFKKISLKQLELKMQTIKLIVILGVALFLLGWCFSLVFPALYGKFDIGSRIIYGIASGMIIFGISFFEFSHQSFFKRFLMRLGDASYVLYLVHTMVIAVFFKLLLHVYTNTIAFNYCMCLVVFLISIAIGVLLHFFLERKIIVSLNNYFIKR